ncbi:hypothetical protein QFC21_003926 [Naganishia friedmannii]|uniref:Uncharacterized protein n=1 Tax=Naganishia friedmannii TaxID=89922 RepID=A0ACC2VLE1_9TREE|nr:hypothetical protein QFC21_003926 [Naganishia friedmannii]
MPAPQTVPCQYKTGKTLGSAVVKEAVHIKVGWPHNEMQAAHILTLLSIQTGEYFACKVINKKLMAGREHMVRPPSLIFVLGYTKAGCNSHPLALQVRNEIAVLKRVSAGHPNICRLVDHFETAHNLYLVFELCNGGELFDRICSKGNYYERDAAQIVRTITSAVKYLHDQGIVHRDLKPENLLFRSKADDSPLCIADFGLSRILEEDRFNVLTTTCGYEEMQAIIQGDYKFEPKEYWQGVSEEAKAFVRKCLTIDPTNRPTAEELLHDPWLKNVEEHYVATPQGSATDLLPQVRKAFDARKTFRKAVLGMMAVHRLQDAMGQSASARAEQDEKAKLRGEVEQYKREAEEENADQVLNTEAD